MTTSVNYSTPEGLRVLNSMWSTDYSLAYNEASVVSDFFADTVDINSRNFVYPTLAALATERLWTGDRVATKPQVRYLDGICDAFEELVEIDLYDLIDDQVVDIYGGTIAQMGMLAKTIKDRRIAHTMLNGHTGEFLTDEGVPLFTTQHTLNDAAVQSNNLALALATAGSLDTAIQTMGAFKMNNGAPFNIQPKWLVVPTNLLQTARAQVLASRNAAGATNVNKDIVDVIHFPWLNDDPYSWYLMGVSPMLAKKPFQFNVAKKPAPLVSIDPNSENIKMYHKVQYHWDALCKAVCPLWPTVIKCTDNTKTPTTAGITVTGGRSQPAA